MRLNKRAGLIGGGVLAAAIATTTFLLSGDSGVIDVAAGADLQAAINAAPAGATLRLHKDGIYTGNFAANKPLRIESVGERVVGTSYNRTFTVGARLVTPNAGPALYIPPRTSDVYVTGVELTHTTFTYDIVKIGNWGAEQDTVEEAPRNITLHRVWVRGQADQNVQRGIAGNGANVTVTWSRIDEIHGIGMETQGFGAWNGPGPFNISDNYIAAGGENIMFGGSDSSICFARNADGKCTSGMVATNGQINRNHLHKPLSWYTQHPTYAGKHWGVKNVLELKAAKDFTINGNLLENCWGDGQIGFAVLFTTRNQDGANPWNVVENVQFTNNEIRNSAGGFQIIGKDSPNISQQGRNIRIANTLITLGTGLGGNGRLMQVESAHDLTVENIDASAPHSFINLTGVPSPRLIYRNSVLSHGEYGLFTDGAKGLAFYSPDAQVTGNIIYGASNPVKLAGNEYPATRPATIPAGVGVDIVALKAAQQGGEQQQPTPTLSPKPSVEVSPSPVPTLSPVASPTASATRPPSANNTRIPSASEIVDNAGASWTLSGTRMLRNGSETGGYGSELLWCNGRMYGKGEDMRYWAWTNPGWAAFGADPCAASAPTPTQQPTPQPSPTATATPVPTVTATPTPASSPTPLPFCRSGERPRGCICRNGVRNNGKCW